MTRFQKNQVPLLCSLTLRVFSSILLLVGHLHAQDMLEEPDQPSPTAELAIENASGNASLQMIVKEIIAPKPLADVLQQVGNISGLNLRIDKTAIKGLGYHLDTQSCLSQPELPIDETLNLQLHPLGLDWFLDHNVLVITDSERQERKRFRRVYNVNRLLREIRNGIVTGRRITSQQPGMRTGPGLFRLPAGNETTAASGSTEFEGLYFHGPREPYFSEEPRFNAEAVLEDLIFLHTPEPWLDYTGGSYGGTLTLVGENLIVAGSFHQIRAVDRLLHGLSAVMKAPESASPIEFTTSPGTSRKNDKIRHGLNEVYSGKWDMVPLEQFLRELADRHRVPVLHDPVQLDHHGIDLSLPVSGSFDQVPEKVLLRTLLAPANLEIRCEFGALFLRPVDDDGWGNRSVIHPVGDISGRLEHPFVISRIETLLDGPVVMRDAEGTVVSQPWPGVLVVSGTDRCQQQVAQILSGLRSVAAASPPAQKLSGRFYRVPDQTIALQMADRIPVIVSPTQWDASNVRIFALGSTVWIQQTEAVHDQIQQFLDEFNSPDGGTDP